MPLLAGNDLPVDEMRRAWSHLADCVACRRELGGYLDVRSALARLEAEAGDDPALPPSFFERLRRDVLRDVRRHEAPAPQRRRRIAGVAAAAALVVAGLLFHQLQGGASGLLDRPGIPASPRMTGPGEDFREVGAPYQGLEAQRQALDNVHILLQGDWPLGPEARRPAARPGRKPGKLDK